MLLARKLINQFKKKGNFEFNLHNVKINGYNRGCSGFIKNLDNDVIVYIDTEINVSTSWLGGYLYRLANKTNYTAKCGYNKHSEEDTFIDDVFRLLNDKQYYNDWIKQIDNGTFHI